MVGNRSGVLPPSQMILDKFKNLLVGLLTILHRKRPSKGNVDWLAAVQWAKVSQVTAVDHKVGFHGNRHHRNARSRSQLDAQ